MTEIPEQSKKPSQAKPIKKIYEKKIMEVYTPALLTKNIQLPINVIGRELKQTIERKLKMTLEGKCIAEGYVKPQSIRVLTYSSGKITDGNKINFEAAFECDICLPVEGMLIEAVAKNVTKAGIRAEIYKDQSVDSPVVIFIARDHHYNMEYFSTIKENDPIKVRVIGIRYELNDKYISVIAEVIEPKKNKQTKKPKLILKQN